MELEKQELLQIVGGFTLSGTFINAIYKAASTIMDIGRAFGTSIRRSISGNICPL